MKKANAFFLLLLLLASSFNALVASNPLMRFPDIHENLIVFVSGEDIWSVPAEGGIATRLTIHDGQERYPKFSPDGNTIAFSAQYDGNVDIYTMNKYGGDITRVTFHPGYDVIVGWHPQKNKIIFSSNRHSSFYYTKLFLISPDGTGLEELIMYDAGQGSFSADGSKIAYNKAARESRTWKRYTGGTAQEVYIYDFTTNTEENISNFVGNDRIPMWIGDKIYFSSDRNRFLNIYAYDTNSKEIKQITSHAEYDARRPGFDQNNIVYELGGDIWKLDLKTNETKKVAIEVKTDLPEKRPYLRDVKDEISRINISPDGESALLMARGEIFVVPKEKGITKKIIPNAGSRERGAVWSPDGRQIAFLSDKSGEYEIYVVKPDGKSEAVKLTNNVNGYRHTLKWSPDSKKIGFTDQTLTLYYLDVDSKKITRVDKANYENVDVAQNKKPVFDYSWSPDSRFIAFSKMSERLVYQNYIYSIESEKVVCVSDGLYSDFNPVFSKDGNHLLFISNRRFNPTLCDIEWEMVYKDIAGIYAMSLKKTGPSFVPFSSVNAAAQSSATNVSIDFDGIAQRIEALPVERGNYRNLWVNETTLFYMNGEDGDYNMFDFRNNRKQSLYAYSIADQKETTVIENISIYKLSNNGKSIIYAKGQDVGIIASSSENSSGENLDLSDVKMWMDPMAEWKQMFYETWRMERDYYYEPGMHGQDWNALKVKYGKMIERATCRGDVRYVIGELIGELNTSHTYVYGGTYQRNADYINTGMLGADYEIDASANRYQFKKIYTVPGWSRDIDPPLAKPGVNINEGDYLLKVNGIEITADQNIYSYFINTAGKQTLITVNSKPSVSGAREIVVKPLDSEGRLRYLHQLEQNRLTVEEKSEGLIGYLYFPDTYMGSATDFPRFFYSQTSKKGLIIDGRFNGGGLDPYIFLNRINKKPLSYWTRRYSNDQVGPSLAVNAHMACITNRYAGSGGDMLPDEFRAMKMGPVIGTRTWGGLVGVSMSIPLIDGGVITAPDYRIYNANGKWYIENHGVEPDIEIKLNALDMSKGIDAQLNKAIEVVMKKIEDDPLEWPKHQEFPVDN